MNHDNISDIATYLRAQANELGSRILEMYPPLQRTTDQIPDDLSTLLRTALLAQAIAIGGLAKHLRSARAARIVAECGAGKTFMALGVAHVLKARTLLVRRTSRRSGRGGDQDDPFYANVPRRGYAERRRSEAGAWGLRGSLAQGQDRL